MSDDIEDAQGRAGLLPRRPASRCRHQRRRRPAAKSCTGTAIAVRVTHWINVLCLVLLLMSGLRIFNYHPALYWGNDGYRGVPFVFSIQALEDIEHR